MPLSILYCLCDLPLFLSPRPLWKHLSPALMPLVFVLEVFGLFIRCAVLCVRLFANMVAGHAVMLLFFALVFLLGTMAIAPVSIGIVIFITFIELLVAFLQAYIFTMLSAIFVGLTIHSH